MTAQLAFAECRPPLYRSGPISVREVDVCEVDWMIRRHYIGKWPGVPVATLGYFRDETPRGVLVFSLPPAETFIRYGGPTWELARLWLEDEEPRNSESWFIARGVRYVRHFHRHVVALVSYADPSAGHTGTIYRASNWLADGRTDEGRQTPRCDYLANGRRYSRHAHIPAGAEVTRVPRVSKFRFWLPLRKDARSPARPGNEVLPGTHRHALGCGVAGQVYDPFGSGRGEPTTRDAEARQREGSVAA